MLKYRLSENIFKVEAMFELRGKYDYITNHDANNLITVISSQENPSSEIVFFDETCTDKIQFHNLYLYLYPYMTLDIENMKAAINDVVEGVTVCMKNVKDYSDSFHRMVVITIDNKDAKQAFIDKIGLKPRGMSEWSDDIFAEFCKCYAVESEHSRFTKLADGLYSFNYLGKPYSFRVNIEL